MTDGSVGLGWGEGGVWREMGTKKVLRNGCLCLGGLVPYLKSDESISAILYGKKPSNILSDKKVSKVVLGPRVSDFLLPIRSSHK